MKPFLIDLWHDLREKRLWPVAALLVVALVAVPVVLSKPAEDPPPSPPAAATAKAPSAHELEALASVKLDDPEAVESSDLDTFDPKNPFRPPKAARPKSAEQVELTESTNIEETVDRTGGTSDGADAAPPSAPATPPADGKKKSETTQYQYVIDVTLVENDKTRHLKGVQRLDMLPNQGNPLILFLGVSSDGGNGVFLIDSTLSAAGEGSCKPSAAECSMLYLGAGSEHQFTNEAGDSYELRIDEIRKVKVNAKATKARAKRDSVRAGAAKGSTRRFAPALISDLVSVSKTNAEPSTPDSDGR